MNRNPIQHVSAVDQYTLSVDDLSMLSAPEAEQEVIRRAQALMDERIDLAAGPLFEAKAWKLRDDEYALLLLIDHMISDGVSNGILAREIWALYDLAARDQPLALPELPVQFGDLALWQARTCDAWMKNHAAYWKEHLNGVRPTLLPRDHDGSDIERPVASAVHIPFGEALTATLREAARREGALLSLLVLTAQAVVVSSWCQQEELLIAFPSHGRYQPVLQNVIGLVANLLHLQITVLGRQTLRELLVQVNAEVSAALQHRDFDRVPDFVPHCASDVSFNWQTTHWRERALDHHVVLECADALNRSVAWRSGRDGQHSTSKDELRILPLALRTPRSVKFAPVIFDTPTGLHMAVTFRPDVLATRTIEWYGRSLLAVATELAEHPATSIASVLAKLNDNRTG